MRLLFLLMGCTALGCTTPNMIKTSAQANAQTFAQEMGIQITGVSCSDSDSDLDGFVSCALARKGDTTLSVECQYKRALQLWESHGCKEKNTLNITTQ